MEYSCKNIWIW